MRSNQQKFEVGDIVRYRSRHEMSALRNVSAGIYGGLIDEMIDFADTVDVISDTNGDNNRPAYYVKRNSFIWDERLLVRVSVLDEELFTI